MDDWPEEINSNLYPEIVPKERRKWFFVTSALKYIRRYVLCAQTQPTETSRHPSIRVDQIVDHNQNGLLTKMTKSAQQQNTHAWSQFWNIYLLFIRCVQQSGCEW